MENSSTTTSENAQTKATFPSFIGIKYKLALTYLHVHTAKKIKENLQLCPSQDG